MRSNTHHIDPKIFNKTNIKKNYKRQILYYNIQKFSLIIKSNIDIFSYTKILILSDKNAILQVNFVKDTKKIKKELK